MGADPDPFIDCAQLIRQHVSVRREDELNGFVDLEIQLSSLVYNRRHYGLHLCCAKLGVYGDSRRELVSNFVRVDATKYGPQIDLLLTI